MCNTSRPNGLRCCHVTSYRYMSAEAFEPRPGPRPFTADDGKALGRSPNTVSRESSRNTARPRRWWTSWLVSRGDRAYSSTIGYARRLLRAYPDDMLKHRSAEMFTSEAYLLPRCTLKSGLLAALHQTRTTYWPRARGTDRRGQTPGMTSIATRLADAAARTIPGHGKSDLIKGARKGSTVSTLVK